MTLESWHSVCNTQVTVTICDLIHHYVECLDKYFGNVCELDIIFNFNKAFFLLEEILLAGFMQESNKQSIKKSLEVIDSMLVEEKEEEYSINSSIPNKS